MRDLKFLVDDAVYDSVRDSVRKSVGNAVEDSVGICVWQSIWLSVRIYVRDLWHSANIISRMSSAWTSVMPETEEVISDE